MKIGKVILYDEPSVPEIDLSSLCKFLKQSFPIEVEVRQNFFARLGNESIRNIRNAQVTDLKKPFEKQKHNAIQENYPEQIMYDGFEMQKISSDNISEHDNKMESLHVIFTEKLIATFSDEDFRYHARALIAANPCIISIPGIVEAPAKPKKYYLDLMTNFSGDNVESIKMKYITHCG